MRKLITADVFAFARVIKASGIREDLQRKIMELSAVKDADLRKVGIDTILMIIEALSERKAEAMIYEMLAPVFEMKPEEVEGLPIDEFIGNLVHIGKENDLGNFIQSVSGILGRS